MDPLQRRRDNHDGDTGGASVTSASAHARRHIVAVITSFLPGEEIRLYYFYDIRAFTRISSGFRLLDDEPT